MGKWGVATVRDCERACGQGSSVCLIGDDSTATITARAKAGQPRANDCHQRTNERCDIATILWATYGNWTKWSLD